MTLEAKIGLLLSLVFIIMIAFIINGLPRFRQVREEPESFKHKSQFTELNAVARQYAYKVIDPNANPKRNWITSDMQNTIIDLAVNKSLMTSTDVSQSKDLAIKDEISKIEALIKSIEANFSDKSNLDKATMLNNSILMLYIENLNMQITQINSQMLSRWDVALVHSTILVGLIVVVGATWGCFTKFVKQNQPIKGTGKK